MRQIGVCSTISHISISPKALPEVAAAAAIAEDGGGSPRRRRTVRTEVERRNGIGIGGCFSFLSVPLTFEFIGN